MSKIRINKMLSQKIKDVIQIISDKLKQNNVDWVLTGSVNLALQGVEVSCKHDIDIVVLSKDLKKVEKIFKDKLIHPIKRKKSLKNDGTKFKTFKFKIKGIEVEVFSTNKIFILKS